MSQWASAMSTVAGCPLRRPAMTVGQNSSLGSEPVRPPQVLAKTWLVISMAMSQRIPSHCPAMSDRVRMVAPQGGRERVELHDIGPRREVRGTAVGQEVHGGPHPTPRTGLA